jgi:hypothetical protein
MRTVMQLSTLAGRKMRELFLEWGPLSLASIAGVTGIVAATWATLQQKEQDAEQARLLVRIGEQGEELAKRNEKIAELALENARQSQRVAEILGAGDSVLVLEPRISGRELLVVDLRVIGTNPVRSVFGSIVNVTVLERLRATGEEVETSEKRHRCQESIERDLVQPGSELEKVLRNQPVAPFPNVYWVTMDSVGGRVEQSFVVEKTGPGLVVSKSTASRVRVRKNGDKETEPIDLGFADVPAGSSNGEH